MHTYSAAAPYGAWLPYQGSSAAILVVILVAAAAAFALAGTRLRHPVAVRRPGAAVGGFLIALWLLAIATFGIAVKTYGVQLKEVHLLFKTPRAQVGTVVWAALTFCIILFLTRKRGLKVALGSAFIGTAAAPMLFEFPFDLIVMPHIFPSVPPDPWLYRALYFLPLIMIEFTTVALLALSPAMRITRYASFALAGMFAVFAVWAAYGFSFPAEPLPRLLNAAAKLLCFVAGILLFVGREPETGQDASLHVGSIKSQRLP